MEETKGVQEDEGGNRGETAGRVQQDIARLALFRLWPVLKFVVVQSPRSPIGLRSHLSGEVAGLSNPSSQVSIRRTSRECDVDTCHGGCNCRQCVRDAYIYIWRAACELMRLGLRLMTQAWGRWYELKRKQSISSDVECGFSRC